MEKYIVKVQSYDGTNQVQCGTGIMITKNQVLIPKHVACGNCHTVEIGDNKKNAFILKGNDFAVVLQVDGADDKCSVADIFSDDEILDEESEWSVYGFITDQQIKHNMKGMGIVSSIVGNEEICDYNLTGITIGMAGDYQGLSGSPVFCKNKIIGILQMQACVASGILGVHMSSVNLFRDLLPKENIKPNEYKMLLKEACTQYTQNQIEKNIKSKKYIPDIFVEEGNYKENLRYFADPVLFLEKAIGDAKFFDFGTINFYLSKNKEQGIDFSDLPEKILPEKMEDTCALLHKRISDAITKLGKLRESTSADNASLEKQFYVEQNSLNNSVRFYLSDIKDNIDFIGKKYILLTKDAGQGKTNFVCDFARNFLMKKDYFALYFNAYDFRESPMVYIKEKLLLNDTYLFGYANKMLLSEWNRYKKPLVIIIDGLNENTLVPEFGQCIRDFLEECQKYPYIKVIMTTRSEFLQEHFSALTEGTYLSIYKHIDMCQREDAFKERIFWGYMRFFKITIRENTLTQRSYDALTNDVLLLRFFCEVNENRKQIYVYDVYKYDLFRKYLDSKSLEYQKDQQVVNHQDSLYTLLDKISAYMIHEKTFFNVPSSIFIEAEQRLMYKMLDNEVIFKDEQIMKTGMLMRNTVVISFTFDEFRDFCITNYVLTHLAEQFDFLSFWNQMNNEELTIREGVQKYIFYLARTESQDELLPILKTLPEYSTLYWEYIWGLADCHFTADDRQVWKRELIANGVYAKRIVHDLIGKYDCIFFVNINIRLLFEALDTLTERIELYDAFIKRMFGVYYQEKGSYTARGTEAVWPFNMMIQTIARYVKDDSWNECHSEWYRLTIYLFELDYWDALDLWSDLYQASPEMVVRILEEMNNHESPLILCNVKEILRHLINKRHGDKYDSIIEKLDKENNFIRSTAIDENLISILLFEETGGQNGNS